MNAAAGAVGSVVGQIAKLKVSALSQEQTFYSAATVSAGNATADTADSPGLRVQSRGSCSEIED